MTLDQFINDVDNKITLYGALPLSVPKKLIIQTIKYAKLWFYKNHEAAVEEGYVYINLNQKGLICDNYIQLPDEVFSVYGVHPVGGGMTSDFSFHKLAMKDMFKRHSGGNMLNGIEYYVTTQLYIQQLEQLFKRRMSFTMNPNTKRLFIRGWRPSGGIVMQAYYTIEDKYLFDDEFFFRYVVAQSKIDVARMMGTITMPLVGNAQIDFGIIQSQGEEELEKVKEEIKMQQAVDYIMKLT